MNRVKIVPAVVLGVVVGVTSAAYAQQQEFPNARPVWENVKSGAIASRVPGRMVRQGTARFREAHNAIINRSRNGPTITETEPPISPTKQLKISLLQTILDDMNLLIQVLAQTMLGVDVTLPPDTGGGGAPPDAGVSDGDVSDLLGVVNGPQT